MLQHHPVMSRFAEAYHRMATEAGYRPGSPSDGFGNIQLEPEQLHDEGRLMFEAAQYALGFLAEDNSRNFRIGCSNFTTDRALVYTIEAARLMCGGRDDVARRLLQMALREIATERQAFRRRA